MPPFIAHSPYWLCNILPTTVMVEHDSTPTGKNTYLIMVYI